MRSTLAGTLAFVLSVPAGGHVVLAAPTDANVEGPAAAPPTFDPRHDPWIRHDRRLRGATIGLAAVGGAAAITVASTAALAQRTDDPARSEAAHSGALVSGAVLGLSLLALIGVGAAWELHRRPHIASTRWLPPRSDIDPRRLPSWVERDRRLTRGMIGAGAFSGAAGLGLGLSIGIDQAVAARQEEAPPHYSGGTIAAIATGTLLGLGLFTLVGIASARAVHRRPLRRFAAGLAAGGLQLRF